MKNNIDPESLFDEIDSETLSKFLKLTINRINFFTKQCKNWTRKQTKQYYEWFVMTNLLDLYAFSSAIKINNAINRNNPFYIWSFRYNEYKHLKMERETTLTLYSYTHKIPVKFKRRKEYTQPFFETVGYLNNKFWANIQNDNFRLYSLDQKVDAWINIRDFLQFILDNKPVDFLNCEETYFGEHKHELYSWYCNKK